MIRDLLTTVLAIAAVAGASSVWPAGDQQPVQPPSNRTPQSTAPSDPLAGNDSAAQPAGNAPAPPVDPAAIVFDTPSGMVFHAVKPASVLDYEEAIAALQAALSVTSDEETARVAASWRVFKASETDAKKNALYIHWLQPASPAVDYRPSLWLDRLLDGAPADLLTKYRDAFAVPPTRLGLSELAHMAVPPPPRPSNTTPAAPSANRPPAAPARNGTPG